MKKKPLIIGAGIGLLVGLLLLGVMVLFGLCPLLSLLLLPAMWALVFLGANGLWLVPITLVQWTFLGALTGFIVSNWGQMSRPRRWIVYAAASLMALGVCCWIGSYMLDDGQTKLSPGEEQVYQGELPGCGPVIFNWEWRDDDRKPVFSQQTGEDWHWQQQIQKDTLHAVLMAGDTNVLGWLVVSNRPAGGWVQGQWRIKNGKVFQPVKFQQVAALREREHFYSYYDLLNLSVTETREFPIFPAGWHMGAITHALDQDWWREQWEAQETGPTWFKRVKRKVKSLFAGGHGCEPINSRRRARVLRVSDRFVVVETTAGLEEGMPARSEEHQIWNYVSTNGGFRRFELAELFKTNMPWGPRLIAFCEPRLKTNQRFEGQFDSLTRKDLDQFTVLRDGLLIRFYPAMGDFDDTKPILIPWPQLQDVLKPSGPAQFFAQWQTGITYERGARAAGETNIPYRTQQFSPASRRFVKLTSALAAKWCFLLID